MARIFCIPGAFLVFTAFILNLIASVSLPFIPGLGITHTRFRGGVALEDGQNAIERIDFGVWAPCFYNPDDDRTCFKSGLAYTVRVTDADQSNELFIKASWTRGLAIHPLATALGIIAFLLALIQQPVIELVAFVLAWFTGFVCFIAFFIDIALFAWTKHEFNKLAVDAKTSLGAGFWLNFVAFLCLSLGGLSVCCGRMSDNLKRKREQQANNKTIDVEDGGSHEKNTTAKSRFAWNPLKIGKQ